MMISKWALIRRNELVDLPERITIHKDFLGELSEEEFEYSFRQIHELFYQIYTDMAEHPETFGFPLYGVDEYDYFSKEAREVRTAPWKLFYLLLEFFAWGEPRNGVVAVDMATFRELNQVKKTDALIRALEDYSFVFADTKNGKLPPAGSVLEIDYPDNRNILVVLSLTAKKVMNTQLKNVSNYFSHMVAFCNGFISWNYKLLQEDFETCSLAEGCDYVADKVHNDTDREFVVVMDKTLKEAGFAVGRSDSNEGPAILYYKSRSAYDFALVSLEGELVLELRIRNAEKCMEYLMKCPERVVKMFRQTDVGCQNRINSTCKCGVKYVFEGEEKWHCGCCGAPFKLHPVQEDMAHYLQLVELGKMR